MGDKIVGLREKGIRSNGLSLVRKIFEHAHGENWHEVKLDNKSLAEIALQPSTIYSKAVVEMMGGLDDEPAAEVHGVAHITGGGVPGKLGRVLKPTDFGADLDDLFEPAEIIKYCQERGNVPDHEAYRTWNMGQGMVIITPEPDQVISIADKYRIEAKTIGKITERKGIQITNKGYFAAQEPNLEFKN